MTLKLNQCLPVISIENAMKYIITSDRMAD